MSRITYSGPVKSNNGFEIGSGGSRGGTDTTIIDSSGNITTTGTLAVSGGISGTTAVVSTTATAETLTTAQSGSVVLVSATGACVITLPSTAAGLNYTIYPDADVACNVSPASADGIYGKVVTGATSITAATGTVNKDLISAASLNARGDYIKLVADGTDGWYIAGGIGSWTVEA